MNLGIDELLQSSALRARLRGRRAALLGHAASVTRGCRHSLDALMDCPDVDVVSAFGPQHGMRADRQDNMIETGDCVHPRHGIPVFSLYGEVRRPTDQMMETFDVLLVDLQDVGCRSYTYVTTLAYMLEACSRHAREVWVLDRPNPIGRPIEGTTAEPGWESFVAAGPLILRHGLTMGEIARWYVSLKNLDLQLHVVPMSGYAPDDPPGFGWPLGELSWVNPSPNASSLNMARCFPGTVLFEGTTLSEGRGTGTPLELVGAPDVDFDVVLGRMESLAPHWLEGCSLRPCHFEPTFQKYIGTTCSGIQIHADGAAYRHEKFRPYRLGAVMLKAIRLEYTGYDLWREFEYEYETQRLAIDLITGGTLLRDWVDDPQASPAEFDERLAKDEQAWAEMRQPYLLY